MILCLGAALDHRSEYHVSVHAGDEPMSVARQEKKLMTAEELWEMPEVPGKRFELVRGELAEVPGASVRHGQIVASVFLLLHTFASERGLGVVLGDGVAYIIRRDPDTVRVPDASFIASERLPVGELPETFREGAPDLAVEVVSPNDEAEEVRAKVREYLQAGSRLVWVVWPRLRTVSVYSPVGITREVESDDELEGGEVLPGFRARVSDLFEACR